MISILMPIYNGIEFIGESIPTILYQSFQDWELIIGVNGHEKDSPVYKEALTWASDRIRVYDLYNIKGKSDALNEMIHVCTYDWIALLDVDDKWLPRKLERQMMFKNYDVIGTQCKYFGDLNTSPSIPYGDLKDYNFLLSNPIINSSCLIRKELCLWKDRFVGLEDYDLWLKLWRQGKTFYNISDIHVLHRIHTQSAFNAKGNHSNVNHLRSLYKDFIHSTTKSTTPI
jgi:teichuronic acid biosynthesis glycosyltransferase TuaG